MKEVFKFIKQWASVIIFAAVIALLPCALICCVTQLCAKIGMFWATCGTIGTVIAIALFAFQLVFEINDRRAM